MGGNFGTGFAKGIGNTGQVMAGQMMDYHKEHVAALQKEGALKELRNYAVNPSGQVVQYNPDSPDRDKNLIPFVQSKALDLAVGNAKDERHRREGALDVATKLGMRQVVDAMLNPTVPVQIPGVGKVNLTGSQAATYGAANARIAAGAPVRQARLNRLGSQTALDKVKFAQQTGVLPKPVQPPTGGQIAVEQRSLRKEALKERQGIEKQLSDVYGVDPESVVDPSAVQYGTMQPTKMGFGNPVFTPSKDPFGATHVLIPGKMLPVPVNKYDIMQKKAARWQELGKPPPPAVNAPPAAMQHLVNDPSPQNKAFFDQIFGKGASDTVIGAQSQAQPSADTSDTPDEP